MIQKLKEIAHIDGYTIGQYQDEIYVIDPAGLMAWLNNHDKASALAQGFPNRVPSRVVRFVMKVLTTTSKHQSEFSPIHVRNEAHHKPRGNQMNRNQTAWLFPGQGSQQIAMGQPLQAQGDYFDSAFDLAEEFSELPLRKCVSRGPELTLTRTDHAQPAIVALSVAYVDFLRDRGVKPGAVAGHSLGELTALYAAEVLSAKDTIRLAAKRGQLMSQAAEGTMVAVKGLTADEVDQNVRSVGSDTLVIANLNTPEQTVVSGDIASVEVLEAKLSCSGHKFVRLPVSGAWHSSLVAGAADEFAGFLDAVTWCKPTADVFLGALGQKVSDVDEIRQVMKRQIVSPVHWHKTMGSMIDAGFNDFLEVGPGKVLRGLMRKAVATSVPYEIRGVDNKRFVKQVSESRGVVA